jgi:hypothetical protein
MGWLRGVSVNGGRAVDCTGQGAGSSGQGGGNASAGISCGDTVGIDLSIAGDGGDEASLKLRVDVDRVHVVSSLAAAGVSVAVGDSGEASVDSMSDICFHIQRVAHRSVYLTQLSNWTGRFQWCPKPRQHGKCRLRTSRRTRSSPSSWEESACALICRYMAEGTTYGPP